MLSRLVIWILLALVPFQSFAAVGLIQCPAGRAELSHVHHSVVRHTSEGHDASAIGLNTPLHAHQDSSAGSGTDSADNATPHHLHKLPCCSDGAIIFSPEVALSSRSERFTKAASPEPVDLTSVYLEGPKRPPRETLV